MCADAIHCCPLPESGDALMDFSGQQRGAIGTGKVFGHGVSLSDLRQTGRYSSFLPFLPRIYFTHTCIIELLFSLVTCIFG